MTSAEEDIRSKVVAFANELAVLVRRAVLEAAQARLGGATEPASTQRGAARARARPAKPGTPVAAREKSVATTMPPVSKKSATSKRGPGEKRPPAELAKLTEKLGEYIKAHPGVRMEAIAKGLGTPTRELNLPVKKLLAAKRVRTKGEKRATEYFPV